MIYGRQPGTRQPMRACNAGDSLDSAAACPCARISLVIPVYNEARRLPRTLAALRRYGEHQRTAPEILVVDDGSTDGTAEVAEHAGVPELRVIRCPHRGKGAAVRAGMLAAGGQWVLLCDADLSMPPEQLDRLVQALESGAAVAVGSREAPGARRFHEPLLRHLMGRIFNLLVRLLVLRGLRDTQCGFKAFDRATARDLFSRQYLDGFSFDVEVLFLAQRHGYPIIEVPIDWYFDADSRVRATAASLEMARDVLRIRYRAWRGAYRPTTHPDAAPSGTRHCPPATLPTGKDQS